MPSTSLVPFADQLNHRDHAQITVKMLHKGLHLESNKNYLHETDFENFDFDTTTSK